MSHEFRTPLNSILALTRLLLARIDGAADGRAGEAGALHPEGGGEPDRAGERSSRSRQGGGGADVVVAPPIHRRGSVRHAARHVAAAAGRRCGGAGLRGSASDLPPMDTDEGKVSQILRNFISNAMKFTEHGEVRVCGERPIRQPITVVSGARHRHRYRRRRHRNHLAGVRPGRESAAGSGEGHGARLAAVEEARRAARRLGSPSRAHPGERLDILCDRAAGLSHRRDGGCRTGPVPWNRDAYRCCWWKTILPMRLRSNVCLPARSISRCTLARCVMPGGSCRPCGPTRSCSTSCCSATRAGVCCWSCAPRTRVPTYR